MYRLHDITSRNRVNREDAPEERLPSLKIRLNGLTSAASTPVVSSLTSEDSTLKRKYEKSLKSVPRATSPPPNQDVRKQEQKRKERSEAIDRNIIEKREKDAEEEEEDDDDDDEDIEEEKPKPALSSLKSWKSLIPTMEELRLRVEMAEEETKKVVDMAKDETLKDPTKVQLVKNFRRPILILPYIENPTGPDFLLHKYPNSLQYYSEDNFRFGEKRPTE
uniref:Uncharacterized protein n=1 Tax=Caenorhabditis japonica TaxID=281687 RepID=A0A8R1IQB6_CAEJA